ncbi:2-oxo-4-hydroxy-4-carboxy-5-ureidoimidazoline decarboxylase [Bradyrhizobium sp.]|jgi:2-oxo-4-hydroxy-4-carboxy-5-ureidoimidazoline decarboxylase|uniref:2-oxo-4-hydroxy-4-carboxy-5-ureidoimidazoline decarboxylase n=1 Tax=Bradyrhizobium sp. TaxID=376 RepID=UPI002E0408DF|nr:2-oxo-4-hydroxy-4-carboxy-5-ureidoimidazoline decarboxylase [Bradyrhizobium sp.]
MTATSQTPLADLNACSRADFIAALANIFEYSPWIAEQAADARPFAGVTQLFEAMKAAVARAPSELRLALIKAHPDLANKTQRAAGLTAESSAEQNSVGLDRLSDAEYAAFERVHNAYREKFGFPYIVCVRRHTKDSILSDFERRLPNDVTTEIAASIAEICRIAALRVDQRVTSDDRLPVHGRLSTHVLDTHSGKPAEGIPVELVELSVLGGSGCSALQQGCGRVIPPPNRPGGPACRPRSWAGMQMMLHICDDPNQIGTTASGLPRI